ncbi:MAG: efflux RND transporter periplasmic adaptor subunit [Bryobacteraceae bacterium]
MRPQTSGAKPHLRTLESVPIARQPERLNLRKLALVLPGLTLLAGCGLHGALQQSSESKKNQELNVRTATVRDGSVTQTLRLTGTTVAEKYVSLLTPRLRGNRGGLRIQLGTGGSGGGASSNVVSNAGGPSSGGGSSPGAASGATMPGTGGTTLRSGSNRFGGSGGGARGGGGGGGGRGSQPSTGGGDMGMGSTAASLPGGTSGPPGAGSTGGGGGGGAVTTGGMGGGMAGGRSSAFTQILQELVPPGSRVKKGDVVAEFDRQYLQERLDDYHATYAQAEASFKSLLAELEVTRKAHEQSIASAKADLDKAQLDLKTVPVRSAIDSERLRLVADEAEARYKQLLSEVEHVRIAEAAQIRVAELELAQARNELRRMESNVDQMIIRAPIDGITVMQNIRRGTEFATIGQGDQLGAGQMFMRIVDPSSMLIEAVANQVDIEQIRIGQKAKVRFDAYPGLELPAHVTSVGAIPKSGGQRDAFVKEIPVYLKLDAMDARVIPDLSVSIDVVLAEEGEAPLVPLAAVFFGEEGGAPYVYVQSGAGFVRREVELGLSSNLTAVVRSGLGAGDVVALELPAAVNQGKAVAVRSSMGSRLLASR